MSDNYPTLIDIREVCRIIGGNKPIHFTTYYRGVKAGIFPAPVHPSPNTSRVDRSKLIAALRARIGEPADAASAP